VRLPVSRRAVLGGAAGLLAFGSGSAALLWPAPEPAKLFDRRQLIADLRFWRQQVLTRHPRYAGKDALEPETEAAFGNAIAACRDNTSREDAFRIIAAINPTFRDAHTLLLPWISGAEPSETEIQVQFPFGLDVVPGTGLILRSEWRNAETGQILAKGTSVESINGLSDLELIARLEQFSHGETALLRSHMLSVMLPEWLDAAMGWRGAFEIRFGPSARGSSIRWVHGDAWEPRQSGPRDLPQLSWPEPDLAFLKVPTFDVDEDPSTFEDAIEGAFAIIRARNAAGLVIDVRGNTGGQSDAGAAIIRQFLTQPVVQVSRARERLNEDNNGLLGYRGTPGEMLEFDLGDKAIEPVASEKRFRGPVVVLMDELTYSAGILFVTSMQDHRLALLAGRPTGGFANQTGNMMPSTLPNTGFTGFIATREFVRPNGDVRPQPVMPDITFEGETDAAFLSTLVREAQLRLNRPARAP
jgi:hypothetical protein